MTIQYQLSEQEVLGGILKSRRVPIWRVLIRFGVLAIGVIFIAYSRYRPSYHSQTEFSLGYMFVFLGLVLIVFTPIYYREAYRKYVRDNAVIFTEPYRVTFGDSAITYVSPKTKSEIAWDMFQKVSEDGQYFYLHGSGQYLSMMPKRAFDDAGLEEFRRFTQLLPRA